MRSWIVYSEFLLGEGGVRFKRVGFYGNINSFMRISRVLGDWFWCVNLGRD